MQLSGEQLERIERDGFLLLPGLFSPQEAARLRAALPALLAEDHPGNIREKASGEVRTAMGLHLRHPLFGKLARQCIYKRYRRIVRDGQYILKHMEDELLHELRLQCKKLRYLLEFFACLFPRKKMRRLIKQLKVLQENLGEFTDYAVQQEWLLDMAQQLPESDPRTRQALVASGALIENLERRQTSVKAEFAKVFGRFAAPRNQQTYKELFGSSKKRKKRKKGRPAA